MEIMHHAQRVPSLPLSKTIDIAPLMLARNTPPQSTSWTAIFMKAYGLVSERFPELRRCWIRWPYPHFYEHPVSQCVVLVEREWEGEPIVLGARVMAPERMSLVTIDEHLRHFRETPVWEVSCFRQLLRLGKMPACVRRFAFWQTLYLSGYKRCKRFGTFSISSLGSLGVEQHHPLTPLTSYFTFGPISPMGQVTVKIIYDHRVLDGRTAAHCLNELQNVLANEIVTELATLKRDIAA